jgi:hypothetical protein
MLKGGTRFQVTQADVFPHGCHLVPDSISEAIDYDEDAKRRSPAVDKLTGKPVFQVRVIDLDPELSGRSREVVVKVVADRMPVPPTRAQFEPVEFENLTVTPYVIDRTKRLGYSLRATGIKAGRPMAQPGKDAA